MAADRRTDPSDDGVEEGPRWRLLAVASIVVVALVAAAVGVARLGASDGSSPGAATTAVSEVTGTATPAVEARSWSREVAGLAYPVHDLQAGSIGDSDRLFASAGSGLYAVDVSDGDLVWEHDRRSDSSPAIGTHGEIVVADGRGRLTAVSAREGTTLWTVRTLVQGTVETGGSASGPAAVVVGHVFAAGRRPRAAVAGYAMDSGLPLWQIDLAAEPVGGAVMSGGVAVVAADLEDASGALIGMDAGDGTVLWRRDLQGARPLYADDDTVFAAVGRDTLVAVEAGSGRVLWETAVGLGEAVESVSLAANDSVVVAAVGGEEGSVRYLLERESGAVLDRRELNATITAVAATGGGLFVTATAQGEVTAAIAAGESWGQTWQIDLSDEDRPASVTAVEVMMTEGTSAVFVGTGRGEVAAIGVASGRLLWRRPLARWTGPDTEVDVQERSVVIREATGSYITIEVADGQVTSRIQDAVSVAADRDRLYVLLRDQRLEVRDIDDGHTLATTDLEARPHWVAFVDDVVYLGGPDRLRALDPSTLEGTWTAEIGSPPLGSPAIAGNTVYVTDTTGTVHAIDRATGRRRWAAAVGACTTPVVRDDTVAVGTRDGLVTLRTADGDQPRRSFGGEPRCLTPVLSGDLLIASIPGRSVIALTDLQALRWRVRLDASTPPAIHGDRIAVGTREGHVHVIDTDGETIDEYEVSPATAMISVAFAPDGTILSLTADGTLDRTIP